MKATGLFLAGHELHLGKSIGRGGEGEVFLITNMPGFALKSYFPDKVAEREMKIRAMVNARLSDRASMVAFPQAIAVDEHGHFSGFVMRLFENHKEIHELQTPSSRLKHFPGADYSFIVRVATNLARVFAQVHATDCVVGDINPRGILVSPEATVALIDADSFQVSEGDQCYLCVVGVREYTPPELQGKSLRTVVRTSDHDAFGLAVCLFQLLCMDRHPFSGRFTGLGEMSLEKAIAEYRFAYSSRNTDMIPPPGAVKLDDLTPDVAWLFETAFSSSTVGRRPTATAWVGALVELESALRTCSHNRAHRYAANAKECPWCRMENDSGQPLFVDANRGNLPVKSAGFDPGKSVNPDISALLSAINGVDLPPLIFVVVPDVPKPRPSRAARKALAAKSQVIARVAGAGLILGSAAAFYLDFPGVLAGVIAGFGAWLLLRRPRQKDRFIREYCSAADALSARIQTRQSNSPIELVLRKKAEALDTAEEFGKLEAAFADVMVDHERFRRQEQLDSHLSQFKIRGASIPGLGSSDTALLASYGFSTARDVTQHDVQRVQGIGPAKALKIAAWVSLAEATFQYVNAYTPDELCLIRKLQNEILNRQQCLLERLERIVVQFHQEVDNFERWRTTVDPELVRLAQRVAQAEADLGLLGVPRPSRPVIVPLSVPPVSTFQHAVQANPTAASTAAVPTVRSASQPRPSAVKCPRCGSSMVQQVARRGHHAGRTFWGCSRYPGCKGIRSI